jgi:hypothetical protein
MTGGTVKLRLLSLLALSALAWLGSPPAYG